MKPLINYIVFMGVKAKLSFYDGDNPEEFKPYTQSYAICFTKTGKIVIGRHKGGYQRWHIPGGTMEKGESPIQTLRRELNEELSLKLLKCKLLGAQKVEYINIKKKTHYQLRYFALVELKELKPDPDKGIYWQRKLVSPKDFTKYVKWGNIGKHLLELSYKEFRKIKFKR